MMKRERMILIPLNDVEKKALQRQADRQGMNQREYIRTIIRTLDVVQGS